MEARRWTTAALTSLLLVSMGIIPAMLHAQNASFTGHVTDPTGAVIGAARVVIHDQNTNVVSATKSNSAGIYAVPYLIPGTYTITV
ncbi:MAG: carboxypeptidase-like regulatory domain-containing protein, partial [Terriglobia bacterium]